MENQNAYYNQIDTTAKLYEGCGNRLLIVEVKKVERENLKFRKKLQDLGLSFNTDSVIVLTGNPKRVSEQGFHVTMDIFEPRGQDPHNPELVGSWSTMCGNGVRAVARHLKDKIKLNHCLVKTRSGILPVKILPKNTFKVRMGEFTDSQNDLSKYISDFNFSSMLSGKINPELVFAGLNGEQNGQGVIDGEPHLVLLLGRNIELNELMKIATEIGSKTTSNRSYFPEDINTNVASVVKESTNEIKINACTYERGVEYVTKSCGTGATVIGSWFLKNGASLNKVEINMPGGQLEISKNGKNYYLTGPANPLT